MGDLFFNWRMRIRVPRYDFVNGPPLFLAKKFAFYRLEFSLEVFGFPRGHVANQFWSSLFWPVLILLV